MYMLNVNYLRGGDGLLVWLTRICHVDCFSSFFTCRRKVRKGIHEKEAGGEMAAVECRVGGEKKKKMERRLMVNVKVSGEGYKGRGRARRMC
jgi:hypothetical protein